MTHYEYALMSRAVYDPINVNVAGWDTIEYQNCPSQLGFAVGAFKREEEIVIAFRGTWSSSNLKTDLDIFLQRHGNTQILAYEFINKIKGLHTKDSITFTGHSLGAFIAELCAYHFDVAAVTFESPGSKGVIERLPRKQLNITTYLSAPNAINTCSGHLGDVYRIYIPHADSLTFKHTVACLWGTTSRVITYFSPVSNMVTGGVNGFKVIANIEPVKNVMMKSLIGSTGGAIVGNVFTKSVEGGAIGFLSANTAIGAIAGVLPSLTDNVYWLKRQHSMENILKCFDPISGAPILANKVISWPTCLNNISSWFYRELRGLIPFHEANKGLHTIFNENGTIEAQIRRIEGYKVENEQKHLH